MKIDWIKPHHSGILRPAVLLSTVFSISVASHAVPNPALCINGECQAMISATEYSGQEAFKITDGKTQAIVVPAVGRIMSYSKVGGENLLWNSPTPTTLTWGWMNYGGDKNWLAPQASWPLWNSKGGWPPDTAFDGKAHEVEFVTGGKLKIISPLSEATGIRFIRTMYFDASGDLVIEQMAKKEKGPKIKASIWNITQAIPGEAVFLPLNEKSVYKNNYHTIFPGKGMQKIENVNPRLLRVEPVAEGGGWKIGVDAEVASLASVRDGVAFVQKAAKPAGNYPDGPENAGFPVEVYLTGDKKLFYSELELLGPLRDFTVGSQWTHTLRWSLHDLPSKDVKSAEVADAVQGLLMER